MTAEIGANFAAAQVRRMERIPGYPGKNSDVELEMIRTLMDVAQSEQHGEQIVTKLMRGWRNPALPADELAKEKRYCPRISDIVDAATIEDPVSVAQLQPDEFKLSNWNPIEALRDSGWMYESMCGHVWNGWQERAQDSKYRSHKLAVDIVANQEQRRQAMGEPVWTAERAKADQFCECNGRRND